MAKKLRKYKLAGTLPKLTRAQVRVTNALLCHLPQTAFEGDFKAQLKGMLTPLVHADVDIWFESVKTVALKEVLAEPMCAAVIGLPPRTEKALLEIDLVIAQQAIDKLLGGNAEDADGQRPLSEIEDGVFSFVLLRVLAMLQEHAGALKLEGVHGSLASLKERFPVDAPMVCLSFKLFFDKRAGFARMYLPEAFVRDAFPDAPPAEGPGLARWLKRMQERIDIVRLLNAPLTVEVGRIALQLSDVENLEIDDIILVEESEVKLADGAVGGRVQSRVGGGNRGVITGNLVVGESGKYEVQIEAITPSGEPRARAHLFRDDGDEVEAEPMEENGENARRLSRPMGKIALPAPRAALAGEPIPMTTGPAEGKEGEHSEGEDDENLPSAEASGLLEDITVAMVVELGRVMVSAADVVQLRAGQVIELSRTPGEPVDLVVDGKRVGKGELVEIDGELGVRILSLAK